MTWTKYLSKDHLQSSHTWLIAGGFLTTTFSSRLPDQLQTVGLYIGLFLMAMGIIAAIWHSTIRRNKRFFILIIFITFVSLCGIFLFSQHKEHFFEQLDSSRNCLYPVVTAYGAVLTSAKLPNELIIQRPPRNLSAAQKENIAAMLAPYVHKEVTIYLYWKDGDKEAEQYGEHWVEILQRARWNFNNVQGISSTAQGVTVQTKYPLGDQRIPNNVKVIVDKLREGFLCGGDLLKLETNELALKANEMYLAIGENK